MTGGRVQRWVVVVIVHAVLVQLVTYAFRPALSYALIEVRSPAALLGLMSATFALPALLLALPSGRLVQRFGERRTGLLGGILFAAASLTAVVGRHSVVLLFLATLLLGCGHLFSMISEQTVVANRAQVRSRDSAFGLYTLGASLGQAAGPLLLALPGNGSGGPPVDVILWVCVGLSVALTGVSATLPRSTPDGSPQLGMLRSALAILREPGAIRALAASGIALASVDVTLIYWPALGEQTGLSPAVVSLMLVVRSLSTMASRAVLGRAVRLVGRRVLMVCTLTISALAVALIALPLAPSVLVVLAGVFGFFVGICQPITMSWIVELAPPGGRGMTMSLRLAGNRVAQSAIPGAVGAIAGVTGVAGVLFAVAGSLGLAAWAASAVGDKNADGAATMDAEAE
ncbi:MAG: hypothetical protein QOI02_1807 [Actinomycetota bacterium]|nr:hypothetical protein [Actinomycetota bacterium]